MDFFEVILLKKDKLFLEVGSGLYQALMDVFEMLYIGLGFYGVLLFFCTICGKRVAHFLVFHFGRLQLREHLLDRIEFVSVGACCVNGAGRFVIGLCCDWFHSDRVDVGSEPRILFRGGGGL